MYGAIASHALRLIADTIQYHHLVSLTNAHHHDGRLRHELSIVVRRPNRLLCLHPAHRDPRTAFVRLSSGMSQAAVDTARTDMRRANSTRPKM